MMMTLTPERVPLTKLPKAGLTGQMLLEMGDIGPCELVEGELVLMSPTKPKHGNVEYRVSKLIGDFVETHDLGDVFVGEVGVYTQRNPDTVRGADVVFISHAQYERSAAGDFFTVAPELVVEILPPDDRWSHVRQKLREYFGIGVRIVLVVDVKEAVIELYRSPTNVQELRAGDVLTMEDVLPGLSLPVEKLLGE